MARRKTLSDEAVLDAALGLIHQRGPEALTFESLSRACGLSGATLVQRFGSKAALKQAALLRAWDGLDAQTASLVAAVPRTPAGAIALLVGLSDYGEIEAYAEGLLVLREDLRDPQLRARGAAWQAALVAALDACFANTPAAPRDIGQLMAAQWQGSLLWWSFDPEGPIGDHVRRELARLVAALVAENGGA
ncbi:TetR/AcrR family transcriptional regulator [Kaistia adipata]|uniref:TetR/AcrR family transcriptional regulator n=1 Tax=Kaistia adipata TaxID=166954 RepID=UPI0003FD5F80|nr:TetR/AcrR family transcriptional regulator [Kaistia adipata]